MNNNDLQTLCDKYVSCMIALFNVKVTMTINEDGTVTREKAKGVKPLTLTVSELETHIAKMTATTMKLLAI